MIYEQLKLENQLCFPLYAASHLITRRYKPHLDKLGVTYPQYLVMMVLWEHNVLTVNEISEKLLLNTNTVTPLLKRMEALELISRNRSKEDERKVIVALSDRGKILQKQASAIPADLSKGLIPDALTSDEVVDLKEKLDRIIKHMTEGIKEKA
jgi:DNA-binding MarR family transcriptional regulator